MDGLSGSSVRVSKAYAYAYVPNKCPNGVNFPNVAVPKNTSGGYTMPNS
jgi:hypothetical protein